MSNLDPSWIQEIVHTYGLWALFALVMLECMGVPVPAETALVATSLYAGSTHELSLTHIVITASIAAIVGDNIGYLIGRSLGIQLLVHYGRYIRLNHARLKVGQYLFLRHGGKIVFFGRFVAILRTYSAILAGINMMRWRYFLVMNALGGVCWAAVFAIGAYELGDSFILLAGPAGAALLVTAITAVVAGTLFFRSHEKQLERRAAKVLRGTWPHTFVVSDK